MVESLKDFLNQDVRIGDKVAYVPPHIRSIAIGEVKRLTPKMIHLERISTNRFYVNEKRLATKCIKIDEQMKIAKEKYPEYFI